MKFRVPAFSLGLLLACWARVYAADPRSDFLRIIDRPRAPLSAEIKSQPASGGLAQFHFAFAADAEQRVPGILLKNTTSIGRRPVVIVLHGTGGTKNDYLPLLRELARRGFIGITIDGRYHGERSKAGKGAAEYMEAIVRAWHDGKEHPLFYDTVWDVMRLIDYLETRDDVDATRIGLMGISKGGIETNLCAAVDTRIAVAVPCIGVQSFRWALDNDKWQARVGTIQEAFDATVKDAGAEKPDGMFTRKFYDRIVPGIYSEFDGPAMLPLIAPRPLMTINGDSDDRTPLQGLKLCTDAAGTAYRSAGAEDHFVVRIQQNTGHKVNPDSQTAALEWFRHWLKP
jgi:dienelactone hydrolase